MTEAVERYAVEDAVEDAVEENKPDSNELIFAQRQMDVNFELAVLSALNDPEILESIIGLSREASHIQRSIYGMMKQLETTAHHFVKTIIPIVRDGIAWEDENLIKKALKKAKQDSVSMSTQTMEVLKRVNAFVEKIHEQVGLIKITELTDTGLENEKTEAIKSATKDLKEKKVQMEAEIELAKRKREELLKHEEAATKKAVSYIQQPTALDGCFGVVSLLAALAVNPLLGAASAIGYFGHRGVSAPACTSNMLMKSAIRKQMLLSAAEKDTTREFDKLLRLEDRIKERETEVDQQVEEKYKARKENQTCLRVALGYAKCMDESLTIMHTFWTQMNMHTELCTEEMSAVTMYTQHLNTADGRKRMESLCDEARKDWLTTVKVCKEYQDLYEKAPMFRFLSVNHSAMSKPEIDERKQTLKHSLNK